MSDPKACLDCGEPIKGRADKKFCSDQCRNSYNNGLNRDANNFVRKVNNTLRKNRRTLELLNVSGKTRVTKERLIEEGFNFHYYTNTFLTNTGNTYHFCYDQGYRELENGNYMLVVRQEYVR